MAEALAPTIRTFQVFPDVPDPLQPLLEMAHNLWWVWQPDAVELFRRLDRRLWDEVHHNPVKLLGIIDQSKLEALPRDAAAEEADIFAAGICLGRRHGPREVINDKGVPGAIPVDWFMGRMGHEIDGDLQHAAIRQLALLDRLGFVGTANDGPEAIPQGLYHRAVIHPLREAEHPVQPTMRDGEQAIEGNRCMGENLDNFES